jgi:hypothetical protein
VPSPVRRLFALADLEPDGCVRWGERVSEQRRGIYAVAMTDDAGAIKALAAPPISTEAVEELLTVRPELTVDGARPTVDELVARLASFWLPDETVVYLGLAGTSLRTRIRDYYKTPLGARRPHAGGWFLKTLANIDELFVHYAQADAPNAAEDAMLRAFYGGVSPTTLDKLRDPSHPFPFANLEWPPGVRKAHGIKGARGNL